MDSSSIPDLFGRWQRQAEELRAAASGVGNPLTRESFLRTAEIYESLAQRERERWGHDKGAGAISRS